MRIYEYGEPNAKNVLLQPVGDHDLPAIENEIREIKRLTAQPFRLIAVKVERWNDDLSPWCAPQFSVMRTSETVLRHCSAKSCAV